MIKFNTKIGDFEIPTNYSDMTIKDLNYLRDNIDDPLKVYSRITGLKENVLAVLDLTKILFYLEFLKVPVLDNVEASQDLFINDKLYTLPDDLGTEQWAQLILSRAAARNGDIIKSLAIYLQPILYKRSFDNEMIDKTIDRLDGLNVESVYACVKYILNGIKALADRDAKMLKSEVTVEQKRAGIEMFNQLGDFNTYDMIAQGKVWKYDEVLKIDYNTIFNKLLKSKISAKFDKAYNKILNEK